MANAILKGGLINVANFRLMPSDYKVKLEVFEGPLDLLLYLIRKNEVDIYDVSIERITSPACTPAKVARLPSPREYLRKRPRSW